MSPTSWRSCNCAGFPGCSAGYSLRAQLSIGLQRDRAHRRQTYSRGGCGFFEEFFFAVDHGVDVGCGEFEAVAVGDGVGGAGFDAVAAEDASRVVDIVDAGVALARGNATGIGVFGGFDVDATGGAGGRAQEAADTFFEPIFVPVEDVNAAVAGLEMDRLFGIIFSHRLAQHIAEGDAEALDQCDEGFARFLED
jgi:hypothetical protein